MTRARDILKKLDEARGNVSALSAAIKSKDKKKIASEVIKLVKVTTGVDITDVKVSQNNKFAELKFTVEPATGKKIMKSNAFQNAFLDALGGETSHDGKGKMAIEVEL